MGLEVAMVSLKGYDKWARTAAPTRTRAGVPRKIHLVEVLAGPVPSASYILRKSDRFGKV